MRKLTGKGKYERRKGKHRTRTAFLWIPRLIQEEWRWLEKATWRERYTDIGQTDTYGWQGIEWEDV